MTAVAAEEHAVDPLLEDAALDPVFLWRLEKFRDLKFTPQQRAKLAANGADWHQAKRYLDAGCPIDIAFDLLS